MSSSKRTIISVTAKVFVDDYIYRIDLDADYQREKIWTRKNQEELMDSIQQNIDIPKLYLAAKKSESFDFECIDGKQRMSAMLAFFKPDLDDEDPLTVKVAGDKLTFKELKKQHPTIAQQIENFELTIVVYKEIDDDLVREIFRRLQLGIKLNSGEMLKSQTGAMRDFVFVELGKTAQFIRKTNLSEKRSSREFTLAQICLNSFSRAASGEFVRARLQDLQDFFHDNANLGSDDDNFDRIRKVLKLMDKAFRQPAEFISSRAVAVSAYLFIEQLVEVKNEALIPAFAVFYEALLDTINKDLSRLSKYLSPENPVLLDHFQKYISQASVEPYSIKRRHEFIGRAFAYFQAPKTKGKMIPR